MDELVAAAWPAPTVHHIDRWRLRHAGGVTKRANSVLPLGEPGDLEDAVARAEQFYTGLGLPTVFSISSQTHLDAFLDDRGYALVDPTLAMVRDLASAAAPEEVRITDGPSDAWLDLWWSVDGRHGEVRPAVAERILTGVPAGYASLDGAAVGRAVPQGEWLGVYAMAVAPDARRRGLGRRVLRALLAWGRLRGCRRAYLVVVERNAAARALYAGEGFVEKGGYHYRVRNVTSP
ncbi:N-acetyltransferase [Actinomadura sp. WMMB 499]|uniref:GNAT family N-acetyltransferase n=1 Tax=Actinomadura sp. WMMB 499 TaxID=1219491 RepID=UPI0020C80EFD|nr:GNAT family N-acetyltransferase [Actinomadura sp. WMMB 499]